MTVSTLLEILQLMKQYQEDLAKYEEVSTLLEILLQNVALTDLEAWLVVSTLLEILLL